MALLWVEGGQPCYRHMVMYQSQDKMHDICVHYDAGSTVMYTAHCKVNTSVSWFHMVNIMIKMKTRLSWARGITMHTEHSTSSMPAMIRFFTSSMPVLIRFL